MIATPSQDVADVHAGASSSSAASICVCSPACICDRDRYQEHADLHDGALPPLVEADARGAPLVLELLCAPLLAWHARLDLRHVCVLALGPRPPRLLPITLTVQSPSEQRPPRAAAGLIRTEGDVLGLELGKLLGGRRADLGPVLTLQRRCRQQEWLEKGLHNPRRLNTRRRASGAADVVTRDQLTAGRTPLMLATLDTACRAASAPALDPGGAAAPSWAGPNEPGATIAAWIASFDSCRLRSLLPPG